RSRSELVSAQERNWTSGISASAIACCCPGHPVPMIPTVSSFFIKAQFYAAVVSIRCVFVSIRGFVFSIWPDAEIFVGALFRAGRVSRRDLSRASVLSRPLIALVQFDDTSHAREPPASASQHAPAAA